MKKILFATIIVLTLDASAQLNLPEFSPQGSIIQNIGYVNFEIHYGRPTTRGRKIFDGLVPYGMVWRTGGGESTKIKFDKPVAIGGKSIQPGNYALVTIPNQGTWIILLNSNTEKIFGAQQDGYDIETEVAHLNGPARKTERFYESLTIEMDIVNNNAEVYISWENTQVHFPILTSNNDEALREIETKLSLNPNDADNLAQAVYYLRMNNQQSEKLMGYLDRALKIKEDWWFFELKMNLLAERKQFEEARKVFQTASSFLHRTKPREWENIERDYKVQMAKWK